MLFSRLVTLSKKQVSLFERALVWWAFQMTECQQSQFLDSQEVDHLLVTQGVGGSATNTKQFHGWRIVPRNT